MLDVEKIVYAYYSITLYISAPSDMMLTPELLLENQIVPEEWTLDPAFSQNLGPIQHFRFQEGLLVQARPDHLYFQWDIIAEEGIRPGMASGNATIEALLTSLPLVAVGTSVVQLQGRIMMPEESLGITNLGEPIEDVIPVVTFGADYDLEFRDVQFHIQETALEPSEFVNCLQFTYTSKYCFSEDIPSLESWQDIVIAHEDWIKECSHLVQSFYSDHIK
jgi:hypothetical protein